jgi:Domain of Unknown Function (DUF748)
VDPDRAEPSAPARRMPRRLAVAAACVLALMILGRSLLPLAVSWQLSKALSASLGVPVEIGDVDLALWRGGIEVRGLRADRSSPRLEHASAHLSWRQLAHHEIRLRALELDGLSLTAHLGGDGVWLEDGRGSALPRAGPEQAASPSGPHWRVVIDHARLSDLLVAVDRSLPAPHHSLAHLDRIDIRGLRLGEGEPRLQEIDARGSLRLAEGASPFALRLQARGSDAEGTRVELELARGGGSALLAGRADLAERSFAGRLRVRGLALSTWSEIGGGDAPQLAGTLRSDLHVELGGHATLEASGGLEAHSLAFGAPGSEPALRVQTLDAKLESLRVPADGSRFALRVASLELGGPELALSRDAAGLHLAGSAPSPAPEAAPERAPTAASGPAPGGPGAAPVVEISSLRVSGGALRLRDVTAQPELAVRTAVDGRVSLRLEADGVLQANGHVGAADLEIGAPDAEPVLAARKAEAEVESLRAPAGDRPFALRLSKLQLEGPAVALVRDSTGLHLALRRGESPGPEEAPAPPPGAAPAFDVARVELQGGRLRLADRTVEPPVTTRAEQVAGTLEGVALGDEVRIARFDVRAARGVGSQPLEVAGSWKGGELEIHAKGGRIALPPYSPYAEEAARFGFTGGAASLDLDLTLDAKRYRAELDVDLHDLGLSSGAEGVFARTFGIGLPLAMALLRDPRGNIGLHVPMEGRRGRAAEVGWLDLLASSVRQALIGALSSPLKALGRVVTVHGEIAGFDLRPFVFETGSTQLSPSGREHATKTRELLAERPELGLRLLPVFVPRDRPPPPPGSEGAAVSPPRFARLRAEELRERLTRAGGVAPGRVEIEPPVEREKGPPRVELSIEPLGS